MQRIALLAALAPVVLFATSAGAGTVYSGPSPEQVTDTSITVSFQAPAAMATTLSFTLDGYLTLDGDNFYEDDFSLSLNGNSIYTATFNLGAAPRARRPWCP